MRNGGAYKAICNQLCASIGTPDPAISSGLLPHLLGKKLNGDKELRAKSASGV